MHKLKLNLNWYMLMEIFFLEIFCHYVCFNDLRIDTILFFAASLSLLIGFFCQLFKNKIVNSIMFYTLNSLITILFIAQTIYFKMYNCFFSIDSLAMAGQAAQGTDHILTVIFDNIFVVLIFFIPLICSILFRKYLNFEKNCLTNNIILLIFLIIYNTGGLINLQFNKDKTFSNYQIYNSTISPNMSVERFGVLTYLKLNIKNSIIDNEENIVIDNIKNPNYQENNKITYNETNIDWETVIEYQKNDNIKQISNYLSNQTPTEKNKYTGMFEGKNVIFVLAESLYKPAISEELTPTLYKMMNDGFNFENYYVPLYPTSTADGEYMLEWSLYPVIGNAYNLRNSRNNYHPYGFVTAFSNLDYKVSAYHGFAGYFYNRENYFKALGFDDYGFCDTSLNMRCEDFHGSDLKMVQNSIDKYINEDKFFTYYVSISGHGKYDYNSNFIVRQNWNLVKDLDYSNYVKGYLAGTIELDRSLEYLMNELETAGKLDDTVFVISPDHWPYYFKTKLEELDDLTGNQIYDEFDIHKNALIIYNSQMKESVKIDKLSSSVDVLPTMLNLMGVEYDSRLLMGKDILSNDDSVVIFSDYSWITKLGRYDGKEFIPNNEEITATDEYIENINNIVKQKILVSSLIQKNNYYKNLFATIDKLKEEKLVTESEEKLDEKD